MADEQPTTSSEFSNYKHNLTNKESARFLKRVLQKTEEEKKGKFKTNNQRLAAFTGLDERIFSDKSKTEYEITEWVDVDRTCIQGQLVFSYLHKQIVPTTKALYRSLLGQIPGYLDIRSFRKHLAKMGYVWIKVSNGFVVTERPSVTFERYYYLRDIMKYRKENRDIFYVDETVFTIETGDYFDVTTYDRLTKIAEKTEKTIDQNSFVKSVYAVSKSGVHAIKIGVSTKQYLPEIAFESWMPYAVDELIPILPPNSVVVIKNNEHHGKYILKPNLYTIKTEMKDWLDRNNVPYDEDMSKCQLLSLIDTYTSESDKINRLDDVFRANGHTLLRLPFTAEKLSLTHHVFELVKANAKKGKTVQNVPLHKIIDSITQKQLRAFHENVCELEKQTFTVDMKVDEVLDDLLAKMNTIHIDDGVDSEIPLSDSD